MRVRIIFRGLTLFTFQGGKTDRAKDGDNMGELTAWLVSDPNMAGMPAHEHVPRLSTIGRESFAGSGRVRPGRDFPDVMKLSLGGHHVTEGVTVAGSFLDYVPRLGALHSGTPKGIQERFVTKKIVIPSGRIRAGQFISWDWYGKTPTKVAYMDTAFQGFGANEVIVDVGDDSDPHGEDRKCHLAMEAGKQKKRLWSYTKGSQLVNDIEPNTVEILITNVGARRATSVFWGLHMMTLFDAAGYERRSAYANTAQYEAFERAALEYDANGWRSDRDHMGIGHPFPYLIVEEPERERFAAIPSVSEPHIIRRPPPYPEGQARGRSETSGGHEGHTGMSGMGGMGGTPANDPEAVMVCPLGRD